MYIFGLDLGQAYDYTALVALEQVMPVVERQRYMDERGHLRFRPVYGDPVYNGRHIQRFPLGTPYPSIVDNVKTILESPVIDGDYVLIVDQSGVGRPVVDLFRAAELQNVYGVTITGGDSITRDGNDYRVAKRLLVSTINVLLQTKRLAFSEKLPDVENLTRELLDYRVKITDSANDIYAAREGAHDDMVIAVALAAWYGEKLGGQRVSIVADPFANL